MLSTPLATPSPTAPPLLSRSTQPIVGSAATSDGGGYWLVASDGGVFNYGDAEFFGSRGGQALNKPIVGMAATPDGGGYWLVASDGGVFSYGDAKFFGSRGGQALNKPIVGIATTPDGGGYWLVASDGGVFSYGDAGFFGSRGGQPLNKPIVGMAADPNGAGYWLVASDGGIFNYGDAGFFGSTGSIVLNRPIVGVSSAPDGNGYWLVASDGGIFNFGDAASPVLPSPTQSAMAWPSGRVPHSRAPCGMPSPGAHVGALRGCSRGSARTRRAGGPDPAQDGHRIGGLGGQRRLRGGRRRLREWVVHVHRVEVRPRGVECGRRRRARRRRRHGNVAYANSGLLCAIDNYPANGVQNCGESAGSGKYDYWSYWHGSTGSWVYADDGPAEQSVSSPADDVEGWMFQLDEPDNPTAPAPAVTPSYSQICNASTEVPPPASSPAPRPRRARTRRLRRR